MVRMIAIVAAAGLGASCWARQAEAARQPEHHTAAPTKAKAVSINAKPDQASGAKAAFERLKALAAHGGEWKGKGSHGDQVMEEVTLRYTLTSGGSAVVEKNFPGTEHEMTTIYTLDGDALAMTHYCVLGNQPRMAARPAPNAKVIRFECTGVGNCHSEDEPAMRSLDVTFDGPDRIRQEWGFFENGAKKNTAVFELARVKEPASAAEYPTFYVVFLSQGPNWPKDMTPEAQKVFGEHKTYIGSLREKGIARLAGPFADMSGGMMVFKAESAEAALATANDDPAVKAGVFKVEVRPWKVLPGTLE
ncbi:MAG: YciI family protein [Phycisphaerales bacterium]